AGALASDAAAGPVLRAANGVDPYLGWNFGVAFSGRVRMDQGATTRPVFGRSLRVHDLGDAIRSASPAEDAVRPPAERVRFVAIGEWKNVDGVEMIVVLRVVPRRRGEAVIEEPETAP